MSSTDDELEGLDLSAWEAPEPPDDLADAVIARVGGTEVGAAIPVEEPASPRRRAWVIASVAAAALAASVTTYFIVRSARPAGPATGSLIADRARTLSLDGIGADLDPGANVAWQRVDNVLHVEQRAGNAAWRVGGDERLVIDAGATVASVEATGASLRVEVKMNGADARVIGASALTAAAVSMVTVTVYTGHVKVGGQGQPTVIVQPGATHVVAPPRVVDEPPVVGVGAPFDPTRPTVADVRIRAGESPVVHSADGSAMIELDAGVAGCKVVIDGQERSGPIAILDDVGEYAYSFVCPNNPPITGKLTVDTIRDDDPVATFTQPTNQSWADPLQIEGRAVAGAIVTFNGYGIPLTDGRFSAKVPTGIVAAVRIKHPQHGQHIYLFRAPALASQPVTVAKASCDAAQLKDRGMEQVNMGQHAAALALFEKALACKPDPYVTQLAFMSACSSKNEAKAQSYFKKLTPDQQQKFEQICIRNGIDAKGNAAPATCDAEELKERGMEAINLGQHAAALVLFERSLACQPDPYVTQLAFMQACSSKNQVKAQMYFQKLTPDQQQKFEQICIRNSIDAKGNTASCDAEASKKKGMEAIDLGQHVAALAQFEASLRCKDDPYVRQLAYMEACNSGNEGKARFYFKKLTPAQQAKFDAICIRQRIDPRGDSDADVGTLRVESKPVAKIIVDGIDTGSTTPTLLKLAPGKHKVTFDVGGDRFTYPVTIRAGQTETMSKDLQ